MSEVSIELVGDGADAVEITSVFDRVWGGEGLFPSELVTVIGHGGGYAALARAGGEPVGAGVGLLARDRDGLYLHSHAVGTLRRDQGVGRALKLHQYRWAFEAGLARICWTFDPLVARNAWFNLHKLGAEISSYRERYYADLRDALNAGDEADRCVVTWRVTATVPPPGRTAGTPCTGGEAVVEVAVPDDIEAIRRDDPGEALRWRMAVRASLGGLLAAGGRVVGFTRDGRYLVETREAG